MNTDDLIFLEQYCRDSIDYVHVCVCMPVCVCACLHVCVRIAWIERELGGMGKLEWGRVVEII